MAENWVQRTSAEYAQGFNNCLPTGPAWPRDPAEVLQKFITGLSGIWGDEVEALAALLLTRESDPRATIILLPDWERAWGLPDDCLAEPLTIGDRQTALVNRMTLLGAQNRAFFIAQAANIGYAITIREFSPFMAGVSRCGDTTDLNAAYAKDFGHFRWEIGSPDMRFYWVVSVASRRFTWFRAASGQAGVDPMLRIGLATDLECLIRRWKPAHTIVIFDYSRLTGFNFSDGTGIGFPSAFSIRSDSENLAFI
jgi:uncharacterized protein YmfQ (DUF2313 family)